MRKLSIILFSGLLWLALCLGFTACGKDNGSEKTPYTITYNLGVVQGEPDAVITANTQTVYYDENFTLYTPSCGAYKFIGWSVEGEDALFDATKYPFKDNVTLVANWKVPYYISYNLGQCADNPNASIAKTQQLVYVDETFDMPTPYCGLYKFLGWAIDGQDNFFTDTVYTFNESITLVAQWDEPHYIFYDMGVCEDNPNVIISRTEQLIYTGDVFEMPTPSCDKYIFLGWTLDGTTTFNATVYNFEKDITLVAKWREPRYITYDLGECAENPNVLIGTTRQLIYYGDLLSLQVPTCENYKFMGWTVKDTGESFTGNVFLLDSDVTLVANWKAPCVITYHLGNLEGSNLVTYKPQPQMVYYDELFAIRIPSATGYKFVRWEVQGSGEVFDGGRYTYQTDITVVAVWEQPYTITYKVGEVEDTSQVVIGSTTQSVYYGDTFTLQQPTCPGYNFLGWKIEGQDAFFTASVYNFKEDIVLVAYWQIRDYTDPH